jgi:hypothetical protein
MREKTSNSMKPEDVIHENLQKKKSLIHKTVEAKNVVCSQCCFFAHSTLAVGAIFKSGIVVGLGFAI